ncbi:Class I glutamine amidotransferase-like [Phytophthora cactorum]|nr:Class I glutamine amidotransferase-like [Phytophthora cactorum]
MNILLAISWVSLNLRDPLFRHNPKRLQHSSKSSCKLERLGFRVKVYPSVTREPQDSTKVQGGKPDAADRAACSAYSSTDAETRADELMQAFRDPDVKAIICTIGGFTSHEILEYLDFDVIAMHPKVFCGFSDITTLHLALLHLASVWYCRGTNSRRLSAYTSPGAGTEYMPDLQDAILLIETPEGAQFDQGMALSDVNVALGWLRADGTFKKIRGLIVGRAFAYSEAQVEGFQRLIRHHTRGTSFPVLYGVDVGHTNPIATIPLGCLAELDAATNSFKILECGVVDRK